MPIGSPTRSHGLAALSALSARISPTLRARLRWAGLILGGLLLAAAVALVWRRRGTLGEALSALASPSWPHVGLLLGCVVANVVLSALVLRLLLGRYGRVGLLEMQAIVAAAALLNFLPLRPGLFGRLAYHKAANDIPLAAGVKTVVQAAVISSSVAAYLAAAVLVSRGADAVLWGAVLLPLPILLVAAAAGWQRPWTPALFLRYVEVLVWAVRYALAFALIGSPIRATAALAFACAGVIATMVPFVSNGLGLREWAVGLLAPLLTASTVEMGVTAELVNRAAEMAVVLVLGLAGAAWIARSRRGAAPESGGPPSGASAPTRRR